MLSIMLRAGVLGRGEYLKLKTPSNWHSCSKAIVSSSEDAVSRGKPTMISVVRAISRFADLIQAIFSRYISRVYSRLIAFSTRDDPLCTGRWMWSQRRGEAEMASTISLLKCRGCEGVKRTRRTPGLSRIEIG